MRVAFRIEVNTLAGALHGLPALLDLLDQYKIKGCFLFSLGADYSNHLLKDILPSGLIQHLPAPIIGEKARGNLRAVAEAGHEVGITAYTPFNWEEDVAFRDEAWTKGEVYRAVEAFESIFEQMPCYYGAKGWQVNSHLIKLEQELGFQFATDVRGRTVFLPELLGVHSSCPQIPTTLPTLDELLRKDDVPNEKIHEFLFAESQRILPHGEVFSLSAEREGIELLPVFENLIVMWKGMQWDFKTMQELLQTVDTTEIPSHQIGWGEVEGADSHMVMQGLPIEEKR